VGEWAAWAVARPSSLTRPFCSRLLGRILWVAVHVKHVELRGQLRNQIVIISVRRRARRRAERHGASQPRSGATSVADALIPNIQFVFSGLANISNRAGRTAARHGFGRGPSCYPEWKPERGRSGLTFRSHTPPETGAPPSLAAGRVNSHGSDGTQTHPPERARGETRGSGREHTHTHGWPISC
jgi:hypothetical protein